MEKPQPSHTTPSGRRRRGKWIAGMTVFLFLIAAAFSIPHLLPNIHPFADGEGYRSAQLSIDAFSDLVTARGVRSVICLRGEHDDWDWYREERDLSHRLGIEYRAVEASSSELPSVHVVRSIVTLWEALPHPMLIHCRRGSDRTGLAVAMIEMLRGTPPRLAMRELSWRRFHLCNPSHCPLHGFFRIYDRYLESNGLHNSPT